MSRLRKFASALCRRLLLVSLSLSLAACAPWLPRATDGADDAIPGPAQASFHLRGRATLRQEQRLDQFRFDWRRSTQDDELQISTPFGQIVARLTRGADGLDLQLHDGRHLTAASPEALTQSLFGIDVPLNELADWLRGARPLRQAHALGWDVEIAETDHHVASDGTATILPRILSMRRDEVRLRLVVDERDVAP